MNAYLNYLLEASIGLGLFLIVYQLLLRKETSFRLNRIFLLVALIASVTFPLIQLNTEDSPVPSLNVSIESVGTEELVYAEDFAAQQSTYTAWEILAMAYTAGLLIFMIVFAIRLFGMLKALRQSSAYTFNDHRIVELKSKDSPFSFFNFIFIGTTPPLTEQEKAQIIAHESIHVRLFHSVDIILLNVLGIIFWFNPLIRIYKKIFVQLHEFEADARAVENHDVDEYCSLLAKVALHSADYKLANHFSHSLTLKRIEMMRTFKNKIKNWKIVTVTACLPILFFVIACQDQVENSGANKSSAYPEEVQKAIDRLVATNPDVEYIVVGPSGPNLKDFEGKHAKHITYYEGKPIIESEGALSIQTSKDEKGNPTGYTIFLYNYNRLRKENTLPTEDQWKTASEVYEETLGRKDQQPLIDGEPIFVTYEKSPEAPGGMNAFENRIKSKAQYPTNSKRNRVEGSVMVTFVVKKDGTLTNFKILKGINTEIDQEALRLLKTEASGWKPASNNGKTVNAQLIMPIEFKL